jgi:hypothetical protein
MLRIMWVHTVKRHLVTVSFGSLADLGEATGIERDFPCISGDMSSIEEEQSHAFRLDTQT